MGRKLHSFDEYQTLLKKFYKEALPDKEDFRLYAGIAKDEREKGMQRGEEPDGKKMQKLDPKTIARKRKKGSATPNTPLMDTGKMSRPTTSSTNKEGRVHMAASRREIWRYHHEGQGVPKREHWAIYKAAIDRIKKLDAARFLRKMREVFGG